MNSYEFLLSGVLNSIAIVVLKNALEHGTLNWDITIVSLLSLNLTASLQCHSGDSSRNYNDNQPVPYLTWGNVCLKLVNGMEMEHSEVRIKIRNEKNHK